jgi:DNA-binding NarL/FixJ family response regulator
MVDTFTGRPPAHNLAPKEVAILRDLAQGLQSKEIAGHIDCSRSTVEFYIRRLFVKFEAQSRAQLVFKAARAGLLAL